MMNKKLIIAITSPGITLIGKLLLDFTSLSSVGSCLVYLGITISFISAIYNYYSNQAITYYLNPGSWEKQHKDERYFVFKIPTSSHGKGQAPSWAVYKKSQNSYQKCDVENHILPTGDIEIFSVMNFEGKVVIK